MSADCPACLMMLTTFFKSRISSCQKGYSVAVDPTFHVPVTAVFPVVDLLSGKGINGIEDAMRRLRIVSG